MEQKEHLNMNGLEAKDGTLTIHRIEQIFNTPEIHEETGVQLNGTIQAVGNYFDKRSKDGATPQDPHDRINIQYSYQKLYIKATTSENHPLKYTVEGKLVKNPQIIELKINTKEKLGVKDLSQHIRFNKSFFADKDQNLRLVANLQTFRVNANKTIESMEDNRGNQKDLYEIKNDSNIDLSFDVFMPIFIGQPKKRFKVEIAYAVREKTLEVWLESP